VTCPPHSLLRSWTGAQIPVVPCSSSCVLCEPSRGSGGPYRRDLLPCYAVLEISSLRSAQLVAAKARRSGHHRPSPPQTPPPLASLPHSYHRRAPLLIGIPSRIQLPPSPPKFFFLLGRDAREACPAPPGRPKSGGRVVGARDHTSCSSHAQ